MSVTTLLGIANPIPAAAPPICGSAVRRVSGCRSRVPKISTSAPPELPGLIGALVWIAFGRKTPLPSGACRLSALTMPSVTLKLSPNRFPIAIVMSPTRNLDESAKAAGWSPEPGTLITARSSGANPPTSVPCSRLPVRW